MLDSRLLTASLVLASVSLLGSLEAEAQPPVSGGGDESGAITVVQRTPPNDRVEVARPKAKMQVGFPDELILSSPSDEQVLRASRIPQRTWNSQEPEFRLQGCFSEILESDSPKIFKTHVRS